MSEGLVFNMVGGGGGIKLQSIAVTTPPTKTSYLSGERFDPTGMVVTATYSNGAKLAATGYAIEPSGPLSDGMTSVTIRYTEGGVSCTAIQPITVIHRLESIAVTTPPDKTVYEYGDAFSKSGMVVKATYSDGAVEIVSSYSCSPSTFTTIGGQNVTVSYTERSITKTTLTPVTVERKRLAAVPSQSGSLTYSGSALTPSWSNYDPDQLTISGETSATTAGTHYATFTPTANYRWSDGTTTGKQVGWTIGKAAGSLSLSKTSITLNADAKSTTFTVTRAGDGAISAVSSDTSVATVSVSGTTVTVNSVNDKTGTATITVSVAAGTNHTAPSNKTCAVSCEFLPAIGTALNDISWADIKRISDAGLASSYFAVGDRKAVALSGTAGSLSLSGTYYCYIIGIDHNSAKEGTNRIHFQFGYTAASGGVHIAFIDGGYGSSYTFGSYFNMNNENSNSGGWENSRMRTTIIPTFKACLPSDLQAVLKTVTKYSDNAGGDYNDASYVTATTDDIFLLSEWEVFGARSYANSAEQNYQAQYAYYSAGNSKVRYRHSSTGSTAGWWLRSVRADASYSFCRVHTSGSADNDSADYSRGFAPAFCV